MLRFFMFILHSREIKRSKNFYTHHLLLTPPSNKCPGGLFENLGFTVMLLTSEQNEHIWGLHQAVLLYFLMSSMSNFILNKISNKTQHNCYKR